MTEETPQPNQSLEDIEAVMRERFASLAPSQMQLVDDSARHRGHAGAAGGGGHYLLTLVAASFTGLPSVQRHRLIYQALEDLIPYPIHALNIRALTPKEAQ